MSINNGVVSYHKGRSIVLKPQQERSQDEVDTLVGWLEDKSDVFLAVGKDVLEGIAHCVVLEEFETNTVICSEGDPTDSFYVVLRGRVTLLVDPYLKLKQLASQAIGGTFESLLNGSSTQHSNVEQDRSMKVHRRLKMKANYGSEVATLQVRKHFGEAALLERDEIAPFTALADDEAQLLVIKKEHFNELLLTHFQNELQKRVEFLASLDYFKNWTPQKLQMLAVTFQETKLSFNSCVFLQEMPSSSVCFIKSGTVKLSTQCCKAPPEELLSKAKNETDSFSKMLAEIQKENPTPTKQATSTRAIHRLSLGIPSSVPLASKPRGHSTNRAKSRQPATKSKQQAPLFRKRSKNLSMAFKLYAPNSDTNTELCTLDSGDTLGAIEALCKIRKTLFSAVCMTDVVLYEISPYYFEQLIMKKYPCSIYQMLTHKLQQVESWKSSVKKCIPLFDPLVIVLQQLEREFAAECCFKVSRKRNSSAPHMLAVKGRACACASQTESKNMDTHSNLQATPKPELRRHSASPLCLSNSFVGCSQAYSPPVAPPYLYPLSHSPHQNRSMSASCKKISFDNLPLRRAGLSSESSLFSNQAAMIPTPSPYPTPPLSLCSISDSDVFSAESDSEEHPLATSCCPGAKVIIRKTQSKDSKHLLTQKSCTRKGGCSNKDVESQNIDVLQKPGNRKQAQISLDLTTYSDNKERVEDLKSDKSFPDFEVATIPDEYTARSQIKPQYPYTATHCTKRYKSTGCKVSVVYMAFSVQPKTMNPLRTPSTDRTEQHSSLTAMMKEGHLHLARPWSKQQSAKSTRKPKCTVPRTAANISPCIL